MTWPELIAAAGIGIVAGLLGGLAGIGGSMIMLPALHMVFGEPEESTHHVYMAAAMTVNVAVALPAALAHHRKGAVRVDLLRPLLLSTMISMVAGVMVSNVFHGPALRYLLAAFLAAYCVVNLRRLLARRSETTEEGERVGRGRLIASGGATGFVGGLLGLGGGVLLVPMLQVLCGVRLRQAIATSSAVICVTAVVGAGLKLATLGQHGQSAWEALSLAAAMAPTAIVASRLGARLTHALPLQVVRGVITVLLLGAAAKLAGVW